MDRKTSFTALKRTVFKFTLVLLRWPNPPRKRARRVLRHAPGAKKA